MAVHGLLSGHDRRLSGDLASPARRHGMEATGWMHPSCCSGTTGSSGPARANIQQHSACAQSCGIVATAAECLDQEASGSYLQEVRTVGLKVLKNKLSEYVRLAAGGETVLIADRDRVVAELVPPSPGRAQTVSDAVLAALVREGVVTPALLPPGTRPRSPKPVASFQQVMAELDADRAER